MATIVHANDFFNCLYIAVLFILNTLRDNKVGGPLLDYLNENGSKRTGNKNHLGALRKEFFGTGKGLFRITSYQKNDSMIL